MCADGHQNIHTKIFSLGKPIDGHEYNSKLFSLLNYCNNFSASSNMKAEENSLWWLPLQPAGVSSDGEKNRVRKSPCWCLQWLPCWQRSPLALHGCICLVEKLLDIATWHTALKVRFSFIFTAPKSHVFSWDITFPATLVMRHRIDQAAGWPDEEGLQFTHNMSENAKK